MNATPFSLKSRETIFQEKRGFQMQEYQTWITILGNFGFPVAVSIYLLMRFEKKIDSLASTMEVLTEVLRFLRRGK
jgi:hypothetical protein